MNHGKKKMKKDSPAKKTKKRTVVKGTGSQSRKNKNVEKVKRAVKTNVEKVKRAVKTNVINPIDNLAFSMRGRTTQQGSTTTTKKERSPSYKRYKKGKGVSTRVTKKKTVTEKGLGYGVREKGYGLTKTKTKQKAKSGSQSSYGDPVKTKNKTKSISYNRAANIIKKGTRKEVKQQSNYRTLRNAFQKNKKKG